MEIPLRIYRYRPGQPVRYDSFRVQVTDTANLLDAIEAVWAHHDRDLMFRHACHHASCGSCAVRVNGLEKLPCITPVREALAGAGGSEVLIEPLRNFPPVGDLVMDVSGLFQRMIASGMAITRPAEPALGGKPVQLADGLPGYNRFENCIECGICVSACPTMAADDRFFGPAGLAALERARAETRDPTESARLLALTDGEHGVWRCHSAFECTEACPQAVDPAGAIMALRRDLTGQRFRRLFGR
ncbi:MAG: succinate dehydrogenase/fumarate reductase iron-sulfur subunit [Chloroflexi bacterium]|nr:succinate dehydrogenase/fumarate reductase iron-sulfur subunit [Chloroflexota bacterium]